jgi:maleylpyruvate isomerase
VGAPDGAERSGDIVSGLTLHGYWRSSAAYRVRIALALKDLSFELAAHDLRQGPQRAEAFLAISPQGLVPALETEDGALTQSLAILEWLEERHPEPPLLPALPGERAVVRAMAAIVACDIHPLNNLRVLNTLRSDFAASQEQLSAWIAQWIGEGFAALEGFIARYGGLYAFGDTPGMADCCLVPQVYSARRFNVDLSAFPAIEAVDGRARSLAAFAAAHPDRQPDADQT